jgi:hypothetical protein
MAGIEKEDTRIKGKELSVLKLRLLVEIANH